MKMKKVKENRELMKYKMKERREINNSILNDTIKRWGNI